MLVVEPIKLASWTDTRSMSNSAVDYQCIGRTVEGYSVDSNRNSARVRRAQHSNDDDAGRGDSVAYRAEESQSTATIEEHKIRTAS